MLTLTSLDTATNAKRHRYAARTRPPPRTRTARLTATRRKQYVATGVGGGSGGRSARRPGGRTGAARGAVRRPGKGRGRGLVDGRGRGLAGHVRLAHNMGRRNPSASDIHPRNRTRVGNVSLGTDDAIQDHRTGPGAIPRNKEGKDGC